MPSLSADPVAIAEWAKFRSELADRDQQDIAEELADVANRIRIRCVTTIASRGLGHVGGDLSVADILAVLYGAVLRIDPAAPAWPDRDRFVMSKGHCSVSLYTTLAMCGYFPLAALEEFAGPESALNGHPNRTKVPGVETNTGPLGHGLPVAVGMAIGAKLRRSPSRTVVVLGDGELQEGSNWEAAMAAAHHRLANLTAVVDRNRLQQGARTDEVNNLEPLVDKWRAFGWATTTVDGHDHRQLLDAFASAAQRDRPLCVIANTEKGHGVSFMADRVEWHHKVPTADQAADAIAELSS